MKKFTSLLVGIMVIALAACSQAPAPVVERPTDEATIVSVSSLGNSAFALGWSDGVQSRVEVDRSTDTATFLSPTGAEVEDDDLAVAVVHFHAQGGYPIKGMSNLECKSACLELYPPVFKGDENDANFFVFIFGEAGEAVDVSFDLRGHASYEGLPETLYLPNAGDIVEVEENHNPILVRSVVEGEARLEFGSQSYDNYRVVWKQWEEFGPNTEFVVCDSADNSEISTQGLTATVVNRCRELRKGLLTSVTVYVDGEVRTTMSFGRAGEVFSRYINLNPIMVSLSESGDSKLLVSVIVDNPRLNRVDVKTSFPHAIERYATSDGLVEGSIAESSIRYLTNGQQSRYILSAFVILRGVVVDGGACIEGETVSVTVETRWVDRVGIVRYGTETIDHVLQCTVPKG